MKLLFDQNISFRIVRLIKSHFSSVSQVRLEGLENASDKKIWEYARENNLTIVTFDGDFFDFSVMWGVPPKIIWVRSFDQTTDTIANLIVANKQAIYDFNTDPTINCLEIINNVT